MNARVLPVLLVLCLASPGFAQERDAQRRDHRAEVQTGQISPVLQEELRATAITRPAVFLPGPQAATRPQNEMAAGMDVGSPTTPPASPPAQPTTPPAGVTIDLAQLRDRGEVGSLELHRNNRLIDLSNKATLAISPGEILAIRDRDPQPIVVQDGAVTEVVSPTRLLTLDDEGKLRQLGISHQVQSLSWDRDSQKYVGTLLVGLRDVQGSGERFTLSEPVELQLHAKIGGAELVPDDLLLDQVGGWLERVDVSAPSSSGDPFMVELRSRVDQDLEDAALGLGTIPVKVSVSPSTIDGFGIGSATVVVQAEHGLLQSDDYVVLEVDNGTLDDNSPKVEDGSATTKLRSIALGEGKITVDGGLYAMAESGEVKVTYIFPLVFITATLLGAMLGSAIFVYALHRGRARRGLLAVDWAIGVLVGVGVTALLYAGFQLPKFLPSIPEHSTRTIVPFALAFVAAAMGASLILHWTGRRVE